MILNKVLHYYLLKPNVYLFVITKFLECQGFNMLIEKLAQQSELTVKLKYLKLFLIVIPYLCTDYS